jgi:hypothetical protein
VLPHVAAPWSRHWPAGSRPPAPTGLQVPALPPSAHDMHAPAQAVRQQTPCAQTPLPHSFPSPQTAPSGLRPHEPPLQMPGGAQSASALQVDLHAAVPQRNGKHEVAAGAEQVPAPSQVPAGVNVVVLVGQVAGRQGVPCA